MKNLLILITIMLVGVGCGKSPVEKLVGSYESKTGRTPVKHVYLENGKVETYRNGKKGGDLNWKFVGKVVHREGNNITEILKIEPNGDLTEIASIYGGRRTDLNGTLYGHTWRRSKD